MIMIKVESNLIYVEINRLVNVRYRHWNKF